MLTVVGLGFFWTRPCEGEWAGKGAWRCRGSRARRRLWRAKKQGYLEETDLCFIIRDQIGLRAYVCVAPAMQRRFMLRAI
jgi:hypothetical protein